MQIEENNRMRKTRDLIKKIGAIKGLFHARMGMKYSLDISNFLGKGVNYEFRINR